MKTLVETISSVISKEPLLELFETPYPFEKPKNFKKSEVFYSFNVDGVMLKVQFTSDFDDPVLENDNLIKIAFGRPLKTSKGWIKVNTEELLGIKNPMKVLSTVFNGVLVDFIETFFKGNPDKTISLVFHGSLTQEEIDKDISIDSSKRTRIYLKLLQRMPVLKKYGLSVNDLGEDGIEISNN